MFLRWFFAINKVYNMKKIIIFILIFTPFLTLASESKTDFVFKAMVSEIVNEKEFLNEDGKEVVQQNIKLIGLEEERKDIEYFFVGIDDFEVLKNPTYKTGDKVLLLESFSDEGSAQYYIVDYVRTSGF